ncbi:hypothetical protein HY993_03990 [Candidatus Micrarchaeota archaeon]|nr:hypothetical protein [Candidatus Micrarchaeota archaeon]
MDEQTNEMQAQPQASLNLAVQNALGKMQKQGYSVKTRFKDYSHLKCTAKMRFNQLEVFATSAYAQTSQEVLDGLVLHVLLRLFRFKQARFAPQLLAYKKFVASAQAQEISRQLIQSKGRKKKS